MQLKEFLHLVTPVQKLGRDWSLLSVMKKDDDEQEVKLKLQIFPDCSSVIHYPNYANIANIVN